MANIMSMKMIKNKPSRNGFDLSLKKNFTAKPGEILPVFCKEVYPGDSFAIDLSAFTRTQPLNTAAFIRMREYFDFYFVPYNLLWNKADTVLNQMNDNVQHSNGINPSYNSNLSGDMPYITNEQIANYIGFIRNSARHAYTKNFNGYDRASLSVKLLEYLGYGNFERYNSSSVTYATNPMMVNDTHNIFNLLAYQKIYSDHFRNQQWERSNPCTFNVDYIKGTNDLNYDVSAISPEYYNLFDLRYCDWQKDMFQGVLPNAQYGSESVCPLYVNMTYPNVLGYDYNDTSTPDAPALSGHDYSRQNSPISELSILKLRQYEFLQKWKEIAQSTAKDYKEQIKAHWGVDVGDYASEMSQYLGGTTNTISINEVVNTNITGDNAADIAGKGSGVTNGRIQFNSNGRYGVFMCIYHCLPLLDYTCDLVDPMTLKVHASDFAIPEFDRVGMQPVKLSHLVNTDANQINWPTSVLGYAPRYIDLKTSIDSSVGAFKRSLKSWVLSYDNEYIQNVLSHATSSTQGVPSPENSANINYTMFKVNPSVVDSVFGVDSDDTFDTDQLLCTTFFESHAVRDLDVDGLPY